MNILVTGGAGYIGSVTVEQLINQKHNVVVFDDLSTGFRKLIHPKAKFVKASILNYSKLIQAFKKYQINAVVHLAAKIIVPESVNKPFEYFDVNVNGTINILKAMNECKINKLIFASSAAVYGEIKKVPIVEDDLKNPINPYGQTKLIDEMLIQDNQKINKNFKYVILRFFNVAGASVSGKYGMMKEKPSLLIPCINDSFINNKQFMIYGNHYKTIDKTALRDYIAVSDISNAISLSCKYLDKNKSEIFNLGSNNGYTVKQVYDFAAKSLRQKPNFVYKPNRPGDPDKLLTSNKLAKSKLKWTPKCSIQQMIVGDYKFRKAMIK